jgi:hypothetical protein
VTPRSGVTLPADVGEEFEVYVNGGRQQDGVDFRRSGRGIVFERTLRKDRISGWRWFLGAWGIGTSRQNDSVDIRYEVDGQMHVAHGLEITPADDEA